MPVSDQIQSRPDMLRYGNIDDDNSSVMRLKSGMASLSFSLLVPVLAGMGLGRKLVLYRIRYRNKWRSRSWAWTCYQGQYGRGGEKAPA